MTDTGEITGRALVESLDRLRQVTAIAPGARTLQGRAPEINVAVVGAIIADVAAFSDTANPKIMPLLEQHVAELVTEYLALLDGHSPQLPAFVERYASEAAEQHFPLEALLHAYRVTMRELLQATTDVLLQKSRSDSLAIVTAVTDFLLEFVNATSTLATEHYLDRSRLLADVASDQRSRLFSILLGGYDESDRRASTILRDAGYLDRRLRFCVVLAQSIDPAEMHNPARARRLADYIDRLLAPLPGKRLVDIHRNKVVIVFSHQHRISGWSSPRAPLADRVAEELLKLGPAARLGVSNDVESTAMIPSAYRQAELAFDRSSVGRRVVRFTDVPLQKLLLEFAREEFGRVLPGWAAEFQAADEKSRGRLSATLRAYAESDMNLLEAARRLGVHANTVYARFDRIITLTGRDARGFDALNELLIVADSRVI
jgi:hypothetical protein